MSSVMKTANVSSVVSTCDFFLGIEELTAYFARFPSLGNADSGDVLRDHSLKDFRGQIEQEHGRSSTVGLSG